MKKIFLILALCVIFVLSVSAQKIVLTDEIAGNVHFQVRSLLNNLVSPLSFVFLPTGEILGTDKQGQLWLYKNGTVRTMPTGLPVSSLGQGGLSDIALAPDFNKLHIVYFGFAQTTDTGTRTALARARWTGQGITDTEIVWAVQRPSGRTGQYGARIAFDNEGNLFFTVGDRQDPKRAQDQKDFAGKVMKFSAAEITQAGPWKGSIYTSGHRNPEGLVYDSKNNRLWSTEHGPKGGDELNLIIAAANYGWPLVSFGINYDGTIITDKTSAPGYEDSKAHWVPSIAPSGLTLYRGTIFPQWQNNLFSGNLAGQEIRRIILNERAEVTGQESLLKAKLGRIRDVRTGPDGYIYFITDSPNAGLYRLEAVNSKAK